MWVIAAVTGIGGALVATLDVALDSEARRAAYSVDGTALQAMGGIRP